MDLGLGTCPRRRGHATQPSIPSGYYRVSNGELVLAAVAGVGERAMAQFIPNRCLSTWPGFCDTSAEAGREARPTGTEAAPPRSLGRASLPAGPPKVRGHPLRGRVG